jgi:hypothetical protein
VTPPSRSSPDAAGWGCRTRGAYARLVPPGRRFSWLRPRPLLASRNDWLAHRLGDPTDAQRREWLRRLDRYARDAGSPAPPADRLVRRFAGRDRIAVAVLGDPGEGDASQYAVVPVLQRAAGDTDLAVLCSDVVYPAGGIRAYAEHFYRPYADYPAPIYALPGNHDWYDGLTGFMATFCDAPPDAGAPPVAGPGPGWRRLLLRLLWRGAPRATVAHVADMRWFRDAEAQQAVQPGPYCAIDAGPVRLVLIDTGITGRIDREQGAWLRAVSAGARPKILLTGRPIYSYGRLRRSPIEAAATSTRSSPTPRTGTSRRSAATTTTTSAIRCACGTAGRSSTSSPAAAGRTCPARTRSRTSTGSPPPPTRTRSAATRCAGTRWRTSAAATTRSSRWAVGGSRYPRTTRRR